MPNPSLHFQPSDLDEVLPEEGFHEAVIDTARLRTSESGNPTVQVIYRLPQAPPGAQTVSEYFVVAGANPTALAISRRRLVALYRACGLEPRSGDEIQLADLVDTRLEIRVGHETYAGTRRPRVLGYRPLP
jgi:hypothetical protein